MERNGGVVTEFNIFFPERFSLDLDTYSKMCKDDINPSLFCKVPSSLKLNLSMDKSGFIPRKDGINLEDLDRAQAGCINSDERMFSVIQQQSDQALNSCYLPAWENSAMNSYHPKPGDETTDRGETLPTLLNSNGLVTVSDSSLDSVDNRNFDDNTHSSVEEVVPTLKPVREATRKRKKTPPVVQSAQKRGLSNKDRSMPELIPLICVEDDDPVKVPEEKRVEQSKLTDSPEMPKLVAFSSEEAFQVKKEPLDVESRSKRKALFEPLGRRGSGSFLESLADRTGSPGGRSPGGGDMLQPQVLLRRVSLEQCKNASNGGSSTEELENEDKLSCASVLPSNDDSDDGDDSLSGPFKCADGGKNSSNETPEIEEIEGVRFFQFRSKSDMEEFHEKVKAKTEDEEMIVPTKTADITQIKGWRHKYFAPESEFQYPITLESIQAESASRNSAPASSGSGGGGENGASESNKGTNDTGTSSSPGDKSKDPEPLKETKPSVEDLMAVPKLPSKQPVSVIDLTCSNPESAFVSKLLDDYLESESALKVSYLEKINPNIRPIPPNASILGLGKLFKPDSQVTTLAALKLRNGIALTGTTGAYNAAKSEEDLKPVPLIRLSDSSSDADRSSDDDIPVARLKQPRKRVGKLVVPGRRVKRIKSDVSSDQSQRVVLRLTKESKGESEGYKVSEISAEKEDSLSSSSTSSSSSSSEDGESAEEKLVPAASSGKLEILKYSLFVKANEQKLLNEFLSNLNMLGTSNDVAMLVQSNQSYFEKGPVLTEDACREAVEALVLNNEKSDFKVQKSPKKKLKAWQRYLPKKLNMSLQQKISQMSKTRAVSSQVAGCLPSGLNHQTSVHNSLGKARKKKSRSKGQMSHVEREKRAIRLPARYLDSAVLAAGSEWVSPVFVEEGEKKTPAANRKQLLDVLEKIGTSKTEVTITQDTTETSNECIVTKRPPSFAKKISKSLPNDVPNKKAKINETKKAIGLEEARKKKMATKNLAAGPVSESSREVPTDVPKTAVERDTKANKKLKKERVRVNLKTRGMINWRSQMRDIDAMVEDTKDPYPFPKCPYAHTTRTLEYDRLAKELVCTYGHARESEKPGTLGGTSTVSSESSKAAPEASSAAGPSKAVPAAAPLMCHNGNFILTQQVNPPKSGLEVAKSSAQHPPLLATGPNNQLLLLVPDSGVRKPHPLLPKPPSGARWPPPQPPAANAVWFVQDGEVKSSRPVLPVFQLADAPGRPPERRRKSPLRPREQMDSDVDVETEDVLFDARAELKPTCDFTNSECELIFAALVGEESGGSLSMTGKSRNEVMLMMRSMERLRSKSANFERARSCDEMLHMAQYIVKESNKLEKAYKCVKKVLRLRNIMLLKRAITVLSGSNISHEITSKIKYELIRALALEWESQKRERSKILSQFRSQPDPKSAPRVKRQDRIQQLNIEMGEGSSKMDSGIESKEGANEKTTKASCVKKLFEPVVEMEVLEEPHVQLRILEAPEDCTDIENQFSVLNSDMLVETQVDLTSTPIKKTETPSEVQDVNNSDEDDLLIIDLSGERSKENSPVKSAGITSPDFRNSSTLDLSRKQLKDNSPVKGAEKSLEDLPKSSKPMLPKKKFPGLIPIYKSDFLNEERSSRETSSITDCSKPDKSGPRGLATKIPENGVYRRTTISSNPDGYQESSLHQQLSPNNRQGVDLVKGTLSYDSNHALGIPPLHYSANVQHRTVDKPLATKCGPPEEITLDDSDEEVELEFSKRPHNPHS